MLEKIFCEKSWEQCQPMTFKCCWNFSVKSHWNSVSHRLSNVGIFLWKVIGTVLASVAENCNELKFIRERCEDKNRLCMTICGKDLQKIFKRRLCQKNQKSIDFKQFAFWPFLTSRWPQKSYLTLSAKHNLRVSEIFN